MSSSVEVKGLAELIDGFNSVVKDAPRMRRELHERMGEQLKHTVDSNIATSGLNDSRGKIRNWQDKFVGSGGGYVAVRAVATSTGPNSPGAITNYLECGHRTVLGSGRRPNRIRANDTRKAWVDGFWFYKKSQADAKGIAEREVEKFVQQIKDRIEGGGE
jgi:hypothetical protein